MSERSRRKHREMNDKQRALLTLTRPRNENEGSMREDRDRQTDRLMRKLRESWRETHPRAWHS
jgi:hypothetical protein